MQMDLRVLHAALCVCKGCRFCPLLKPINVCGPLHEQFFTCAFSSSSPIFVFPQPQLSEICCYRTSSCTCLLRRHTSRKAYLPPQLPGSFDTRSLAATSRFV